MILWKSMHATWVGQKYNYVRQHQTTITTFLVEIILSIKMCAWKQYADLLLSSFMRLLIAPRLAPS